jgi:pyrroline-5-carboxylate reductase
MTVITPLSEAHHRSLILAIFTSCGRARFLDEKYFDTCTALAGSGPAFVALVLEAMADGGVMMGLPRAEALELAAQSRSSCSNEAGLIHSDIGHRKARTGGRTASCPTKG